MRLPNNIDETVDIVNEYDTIDIDGVIQEIEPNSEQNEASCIVEGDFAIINGAYRTRLTRSIGTSLMWRPQIDRVISGTYQGDTYIKWYSDKEEFSSHYFNIRATGKEIDYTILLPEWHSIITQLQGIKIGSEIIVIFNGVKKLKAGKIYYDVTIAEKM